MRLYDVFIANQAITPKNKRTNKAISKRNDEEKLVTHALKCYTY